MSLQNVFAFVLLLGSLIFIHEFGHFLFAKIFRIRVEVFSLGFGPRLLGWRRGHTDYRISIIPLGGYVKMQGENPDEALTGSGEEFLSRSKPVRFLVLVMGAAMNVILAVALTWGLFTAGIHEMAYLRDPAVVGAVQPGSPAEEAGLAPGDAIVGLGERDVSSWQEFDQLVRLSPNTETHVRVLRGGQEVTLPLHISIPPLDDPMERYRMGYAGVLEHVPVVIRAVEPGSPAEEAGLRVGDVIVALQGAPVYLRAGRLHGPEGRPIEETIQGRAGRAVTLTAMRDGREEELTVVPTEVDGEGRIGVAWAPEIEQLRYGPWRALVASIETNVHWTGVLFASLRRLVTGRISLRAMSGPIDIYQFSAQTFQAGWRNFLYLMAFVSLQLGIINLLPIPVLDGGHIFVLLVEGALRRDLSMRVKERLMMAGFIFLVTFMGLVISFDIIKRIG